MQSFSALTPITVLCIACGPADNALLRRWLGCKSGYRLIFGEQSSGSAPPIIGPPVVMVLGSSLGLDGLAALKSQWPMAKAVIVLEPSQTLAIDAWLSWGGDACLPSTQFSEMDLVYTIDWLLAQAIVHDRLSDPPLEPVFADREARRAIALAPGHPPYRILIVDDDWKRRVLLQTLLAPLGFELQVATSGQEAILAWASWQPHLILMEMAMAEMDGAETVRHLRTIEQRQLQPETPAELFVPAKIIALAERIEGGYRALLQAGFDDAVARPLRSDSLLQKIADYLAVEYIYAPGHV